MKVFTIESGKVIEGAEVVTFALKNADVTIPAIIIGEEGRGRQLGVLPVKLTEENYNKWKTGETVIVHNARISETKSGRPKLVETSAEDRKSTRLNSSHVKISYAVFCLKKKKILVLDKVRTMK